MHRRPFVRALFASAAIATALALAGCDTDSTPNVGGNTYVWTIAGGVITGGAGTNSITVTGPSDEMFKLEKVIRDADVPESGK